MTRVTAPSTSESLPFLPNEERLKAYQLILNGCSHIWGRKEVEGKLLRGFQEDRALPLLSVLVPLTKTDPMFLAHLTSYAIRRTENKDLQVFTTYTNALSAADGTPFSPGSKYLKPNLREVSAAAMHMMNVPLVARLLEVSSFKYGVNNFLNESRHFPTFLKTAFQKYIKYRESNPNSLRGIKEGGLAPMFMNLYRTLHLHPADEAAAILKWQQKDKEIVFENTRFADFSTLSDLEIAEKIRAEKLPALGVLANLPRKISPVIAVALLEQASGNQVVILSTLFEEAGILKDKEVLKLYEEKIKTATTALDRLKAVEAVQSQAIKQAINTTRAEKRQEQTAGLGKIYLHLDFSGSMSDVQQFASERGAILAECVNDPTNNFGWGAFGTQGMPLPLPQEFVKDAFSAVLFQVPGLGGTDCFQLYPTAREFGADVDIFVSDQLQMAGELGPRIRKFHEENPNLPKPRACVIVNFGGRGKGAIQEAYEENEIPVAVLTPDSLTEPALVLESVRAALQGPMAVVDSIMQEPLLKLPRYYFAI